MIRVGNQIDYSVVSNNDKNLLLFDYLYDEFIRWIKTDNIQPYIDLINQVFIDNGSPIHLVSVYFSTEDGVDIMEPKLIMPKLNISDDLLIDFANFLLITMKILFILIQVT